MTGSVAWLSGPRIYKEVERIPERQAPRFLKARSRKTPQDDLQNPQPKDVVLPCFLRDLLE